MTEAQLEECIRLLCAELGILRFHVYNPLGMAGGFPDDVLIGKHGMIWRELKSAAGALSPEQRTVGYALQAVGADWAVWRPWDWRTGRIRRELEAIQ